MKSKKAVQVLCPIASAACILSGAVTNNLTFIIVGMILFCVGISFGGMNDNP